MELKDQVCSLDLAKRLKELGVKQDSFYGYRPHVPDSKGNKSWGLSTMILKVDGENDWYSAFTVAELGEMLPKEINNYPLYSTFRTDKRWHIEYVEQGEDGGHFWNDSWMADIEDDTEANARAKMLIYLLENKLTTP